MKDFRTANSIKDIYHLATSWVTAKQEISTAIRQGSL